MRAPGVWLAGSAGAGALVWLALAFFASAGDSIFGPIVVLFLLGPLVAVPLGLRLCGTGGSVTLRIASYLQPLGAAAVLVSFALPVGRAAGFWAGAWLLVCTLIGLAGLLGVWRRGFRFDAAGCVQAAQLYLPVGGAWFVLSRSGTTPLGFGEPIVLLTAVHFHFAGFVAPLLAGAVRSHGRRATVSRPPRMDIVLAGICAGPALVAAGFLTSGSVRLGATVLLAVCFVGLSVVVLRTLRWVERASSRVLLALSSTSLIAGMILATVYAVGDVAPAFHIDIPRMILWHGAFNGLGFAVCGLLGWNLENQPAMSIDA